MAWNCLNVLFFYNIPIIHNTDYNVVVPIYIFSICNNKIKGKGDVYEIVYFQSLSLELDTYQYKMYIYYWTNIFN